MPHLMSRAALALASALLASSCNGGGDDSAGCATFRTELSVRDRMSQAEKVFNPREPITFTLEITNTAEAPATLTAASSCAAVVFEVARGQERIWGSDDGIACVQMLQPRVYAARETVTESATWDQTDPNGAQVPAGQYDVRAGVGQYAPGSDGTLVDCRAELSRSVSFAIR